MDWLGSRANYRLGQHAEEEEMDDGEEDFYGLSANMNGNQNESRAVLGASVQVGILGCLQRIN